MLAISKVATECAVRCLAGNPQQSTEVYKNASQNPIRRFYKSPQGSSIPRLIAEISSLVVGITTFLHPPTAAPQFELLPPVVRMRRALNVRPGADAMPSLALLTLPKNEVANYTEA